ncbi:pilin assembly protein [Halopseudomonas sp.]|uniref:pilin assembly protein n=1 Tax=Halopseudomonas sp. TaxID=2901191 RepID=UPI003569269D
MKIRELAQEWERNAKGAVTHSTYRVQLPLEDAARLAALQEMYPRRHVEELITDLLSCALEELEASLPYKPGDEVVAMDEMGDPLYADAGMTPRFLELSKKHLHQMQDKQDEPA